jgi:hypothetical protein
MHSKAKKNNYLIAGAAKCPSLKNKLLRIQNCDEQIRE